MTKYLEKGIRVSFLFVHRRTG